MSWNRPAKNPTFDDILAGLETSAAMVDEAVAPRFGNPSDWLFRLKRSESGAAENVYRIPPAPTPLVIPPTSEEAVRAELDLTACRSHAELRDLRRRFARLNHPDRLPPALRAAGAQRMKIANMLIDEALRGSA
jgi:hypothetical protein